MKLINFMHRRNQIDEVIILNLPHRIDRRLIIYGANCAGHVPQERIRVWNAIPASEFESLEDVAVLAKEKGWSGFDEEPLEDIRAIACAAQAYSYFEMLTHIVENEITALVLYDDRCVIDFDQLTGIYDIIMKSEKNGDTPFRMLQCEYYSTSPHNAKMESAAHPNIPILYEGPLGGSENAMLYSTAGARYFLEKLNNRRCGNNIETTLARISFLPRAERQGIWTCDNIKLINDGFNFGSDISDNPSTAGYMTGGWEG